MSKHITILVSNDLEFDQRVSKVCDTLMQLGFHITLVGRILPSSVDSFHRPYEVKRVHLTFHKGVFFYANLNIRLFFYLLFKKTDVILANDLDTLWPAFIVSKWRGKKLVYDSHELFTEAEGLTGRAFPKRIWEWIEGSIFPQLKNVYTVNESIATIFRDKYKVPVLVVRNIPPLQLIQEKSSRQELGLPNDQKIIILQGAFIDPDRGGKEAVEAMRFLPEYLLLIIGTGRDIDHLKALKEKWQLENVWFKPRMPFSELRKYTQAADIGLSLDKPLHLNYTLSLPNKLFDYIHAETPVLASHLPELSRIVSEYKVGMTIHEVTAENVAEHIQRMLSNANYWSWKENCKKAKLQLNWQEESKVLEKIYRPLISE